MPNGAADKPRKAKSRRLFRLESRSACCAALRAAQAADLYPPPRSRKRPQNAQLSGGQYGHRLRNNGEAMRNKVRVLGVEQLSEQRSALLGASTDSTKNFTEFLLFF
ncbi:MAG: hypothetical protein R3F36_11970 [Candidatus Competibacteraceae bacterium]